MLEIFLVIMIDFLRTVNKKIKVLLVVWFSMQLKNEKIISLIN